MGKFLLKIWMLLPIVPIGMTILYLNRYSGISEELRQLIGMLLIFVTLSMTFLGWWAIKKSNAFLKFALALIAGIFLLGSSYFTYINMSVYRSLNQMIVNKPTQSYSLVVMANREFKAVSDLEGMRIGRIELREEANAVIDQFLHETELAQQNEIIFYDSPISMVQALYGDQVDAIIISSGFQALISDRDGFEYIAVETEVLENITVATQPSVVNRPNFLMESPFSILLIGVDTLDEIGGLADAVMLATVNPDNLSVTLTSIPRDTFIPMPALGYRRDMIAHANNFGSEAVLAAVEHLFGMDIPFYITVNFSAIIELVDTLGGIDINVPMSFSEQNSRRQFGRHRIHLEAGRQVINGEEALALSRHRSTLANHDLGRAANQQLVMEAILRQILSNGTNINDFLALLAVLGNNIETNLTVGEMTSVMQFLLNQLGSFQSANPMDYIHLMNIVLTGVNGQGWTPWYWFPLSVFFPFNGALADTYRLMSINLGNEEPEMATSFFFNGFEPFQPTRWISQLYFEDPTTQPIIVPGQHGLEDEGLFVPTW